MTPAVVSLLLLAGLGIPAAAQRDSLAGPGVSIELARHRAATVSKVRYDLSLSLLQADSAHGGVVISWTRTGPGDAVIDFRGRRLGEVRVNGTPLPASAFNGAHIIVPEAMLQPDLNTVTA
jgi:aminopeptidase N